MADQMLANKEEAGALATHRTSGTPKELVKRVRNAVSTNIGLYEIRMNLFLWGLFRTGRQKEN
jgi:hypothetical protein